MSLHTDTRIEDAWFADLRVFLRESNMHMYAANKSRIFSDIPGEKRYAWSRGDWRIIDRFGGSYRAPGMTVVLYKGHWAWTNSYGGHGLSSNWFGHSAEVIAFLKEALLNARLSFPVRGLDGFDNGSRFYYVYHQVSGNLLSGQWREQIYDRTNTELVFEQTGQNDLVIAKDAMGNPVYPWDL